MADADKPPSDKSTGAAEQGLPAIAPDTIGQRAVDHIDNIVPSQGHNRLPVVGLGGSAGSISALQKFFAAMAPDSGMAFVVVLHLAPEHVSVLDSILANSTTMRVQSAQDGQQLQANTVYVIPPGKILTASDDRLKLTRFELERGKRMAVDLFFRTLADTYGARATAIILSGADGDGALGLKRVKERGGLTIAQEPSEAEHVGMPQTAIDTGMVDWVLPVGEMPARLTEYRRNEARLRLPSEGGPEFPKESPPSTTQDVDENALREILAYLRVRTARDFSYYKRATILRRISRRMQVNGTTTMGDYLAFLRTHAGESGALQQDLLISVTNFFRDHEVFEALKEKIPGLFEGKVAGDAIRVWTPACATGEEAFSIAILLHEYAAALESPPIIQVFATDLAEDVIATARDGLFPATIQADVSEERLRRFFTKEPRGYRVRREVRESVLFAVHDVLRDAPFSRIDLITCRNLLIYLNVSAQKRVLDVFHFALRPKGLLLLGSSESVEEESSRWMCLDKKHRIFRQSPAAKIGMPVSIGPDTVARAVDAQENARNGPAFHGVAFSSRATTAVQRSLPAEAQPVSWEELHFKMIERFSPPSIIVTRDYDIVHVSQNAGALLHFSVGEPSINLLQVVNPMLRIELRAALFRAAQANAPVEVFNVPVEMDDRAVSVDIRICPAEDIVPDYLLVVLDVREAPGPQVRPPQVDEPAVRHLERENEEIKRRLRDVVEQYEASGEELKAGNEELQAMNEELRSSAEELETSREELQSINEELTTVNQELKTKVDELSKANTDFSNLMAATGVATIFLDRRLRIMRFTPTAVSLFNLIDTDLGRPLSDITHQLNYPNLQQDAQKVLTSLIPIKREAAAGERWYLAQILPYRTSEDQILGVVFSFVDITDNKRAEQMLLDSKERMRMATESAGIYVWECDWVARTVTYAKNAARVLGFILPSSLEENLALVHPDDRTELTRQLESAWEKESRFDVEFRFMHPQTGESIWQSAHGTYSKTGDARRFVAITQDITARKRREEAFQSSQERLRLMLENAREYAIFSLDFDRRVRSWNTGAERLLGYSESEIIGETADVIFTSEDREAGVPEQEIQTALKQGRSSDERWHLRKDGTRFWGSGSLMSMHDGGSKVIGFVKIFRDQTAERNAREALERSQADLWAALQENAKARVEAESATRAKDQFMAILSHELRTPLTPVTMGLHLLERLKDLPADASELLSMIKRNVQIETRFIDELLDVSRITHGKLEIIRKPVDVHEIIRSAIATSKPDIEEKDQCIQVNLDAAEHTLMGDPDRLQQVFWNLLKNASKFTGEGGQIRIISRNEDKKVLVEMADTGIGFLPEAASKIFDPFSQGADPVIAHRGGLGLGLAIAKAIVEGHDGSIRAASAGPDQGSTFSVELPL